MLFNPEGEDILLTDVVEGDIQVSRLFYNWYILIYIVIYIYIYIYLYICICINIYIYIYIYIYISPYAQKIVIVLKLGLIEWLISA